MAEILEEFDQPSPLPVVFCQKIPLEEFDQHSAKTTRAALQELMNHLDSNPDEYYKIVRRKKADNLKLLQFMKVKVMNKLQDGYLEKYFPPEQCQEDLENLKHEMASAYDYAQDGKKTGVRFSRRLAEKRKLKDPLASSTPRRPAPSAPPPPPPPPPPPIINMSTTSQELISPVTLNIPVRVKQSDFPETPSGTFSHERRLLQAIRNVSPRRKLRDKASEQTKPASSELKENNVNNNASIQSMKTSVIEQKDIAAARDSLKATRSSSDDSPYQLSRARRRESNSAQEENYSLFNMELIKKFHNARSPSSSPSGNITVADSGFESP